MQPLSGWILDHTHMLTSKLNIHSLATCVIFGVNIYVLLFGRNKYINNTRTHTHTHKTQISLGLNCLVLKINDKMSAQAMFSRSHLNIYFRDIDLFCVTYPGPFFVIKREQRETVEVLSVLWQSQCMCV